MNNELKEKLQSCINNVKDKDISTKSIEEISALLKTEFSRSLNMTDEKWKKIFSITKTEIDLEHMTLKDTTFESALTKLAKSIKKGKEKENIQEGANSEKQNKNFKFTLNINKKLKEKIANLNKNDALITIKYEIIDQAQKQGISEEMLNKTCTKLSQKSNLNLSATFPENTKFIDALTQITYDSVIGKNPFGQTQNQEEPKPKNPIMDGIQDLVDDALGKNQTDVAKENEKYTIDPHQMNW